jgi:transcriptional regulator GlxA family with amidase domain
MEKNLEDPISIKILSKMLNISHRMLERKFQRFLNTSPYKFYLELRLRKAKNLLLQTDISVINVAFACGFVSPGHFSKSYKSKYGLSPFAERKSR